MSLKISTLGKKAQGKSKKPPQEKTLAAELRKLTKGNNELEPFKEFFDDRFLLHFIRGKKGDVEKAFVCLQNYMEVRTGKERALFKEMRPSNCNQMQNCKTMKFLKSKDDQNRLVIADRIRFWDPDTSNSDDCLKLFIMGAEEIWNSDEAELNGVVLIMDAGGCNYKHFKAGTPALVFRLINVMFTNFPMRMQNVHIVNEHGFLSILLRTIKPLLPKKLKDRLHVHGSNLESLHKHVSPAILPVDLGGELSDEDCFDESFEARIAAKEEYYARFAGKL